MDTDTPILYTRAQLRGLKQEQEDQKWRQNVKVHADKCRHAVVAIAKQGGTNYVYKINRELAPAAEAKQTNELILAVIHDLKISFPDITITHDKKLGPLIQLGGGLSRQIVNHEICIDWS